MISQKKLNCEKKVKFQTFPQKSKPIRVVNLYYGEVCFMLLETNQVLRNNDKRLLIMKVGVK